MAWVTFAASRWAENSALAANRAGYEVRLLMPPHLAAGAGARSRLRQQAEPAQCRGTLELLPTPDRRGTRRRAGAGARLVLCAH